MGCLPLIVLFVLGTGIGWWLGGPTGAVWGAGIGLTAGAVLGLVLVYILHRARSDTRVDP